jgi:hypothetical protein
VDPQAKLIHQYRVAIVKIVGIHIFQHVMQMRGGNRFLVIGKDACHNSGDLIGMRPVGLSTILTLLPDAIVRLMRECLCFFD